MISTIWICNKKKSEFDLITHLRPFIKRVHLGYNCNWWPDRQIQQCTLRITTGSFLMTSTSMAGLLMSSRVFPARITGPCLYRKFGLLDLMSSRVRRNSYSTGTSCRWDGWVNHWSSTGMANLASILGQKGTNRGIF